MLERKPTFDESRLIRSLFMLFVDNDEDAQAVADDADVTLEDVRDFMREAL